MWVWRTVGSWENRPGSLPCGFSGLCLGGCRCRVGGFSGAAAAGRALVWGSCLVVVGVLFENCTVDASIFVFCVLFCCCEVFMGAWWMPWHQEPMKDVVACDKPRGVGERALIRGCPNGETRQSSWTVTVI